MVSVDVKHYVYLLLLLALALSWLTLGCLLKKVNKPARNLPVPEKGWDLSNQAPMKLRILKVVLLIVRLSQDSAEGVKGRSLYISVNDFLKKSLSVCVASCLVVCIFSRHCICCAQVWKNVCDPWYTVTLIQLHWLSGRKTPSYLLTLIYW